MLRLRKLSLWWIGIAVGVFVVGGLTPPARAALLSGTTAGGIGGGACDDTVTCGSWRLACQQQAGAPDVDSSVRQAGQAAGKRLPYHGACKPRKISMAEFTSRTGQVDIPAGAVWVTVRFLKAHQSGQWSIG